MSKKPKEDKSNFVLKKTLLQRKKLNQKITINVLIIVYFKSILTIIKLKYIINFLFLYFKMKKK